MFTVVIPAYNESTSIETTIKHVQSAFLQSNTRLEEIIVADDDSTDDTAMLAERAGARVVVSGKRNIGATRNVGASHSTGEWLLFIDADTNVMPNTIQSMCEAIQQGYIGGGAKVAWSEKTKPWGNWGLWSWNLISRITVAPAGSFFFARRDLFECVGGFDEKYYASEELHLGRALKKHGKLIIIPHPVYTSPRKIHQFTLHEFGTFFFHLFCKPTKVLGDRKYLDIWYERRS